MTKPSLIVGGNKLSSWQEVMVTKSMQQLTGTFSFQATDVFPGEPRKWGVRLGDPCKVMLGDHLIMEGWIEEMPIAYDAGSHDIRISGRDKLCDLVDCSHAEEPNTWTDQTLLSIIEALCEPFGIEVVADDSVTSDIAERIPIYKTPEGGTIHEMLVELCGHKAILPLSLGDGNLTLTRRTTSSYATDSIVLGRNVLRGGITQSNMDRFSRYVVKGQQPSMDLAELDTTNESSGEVEDKLLGASRYRPIVIIAGSAVSSSDCARLAEWEARIRAGQSRSLSYEINGWEQSNGEPWQINILARVKDSFFDVNGTFLVSEVQHSMSLTDGMRTALTLVSPEAYDLMEKPIEVQEIGGAFDMLFDEEYSYEQ